MSPIEEETLRRKLAVITENLQALLPIKDLIREEYATDTGAQGGSTLFSQAKAQRTQEILSKPS
jgi:hypothetical protein